MLASPFATRAENSGYDAIVYTDGDLIVAKDTEGNVICENTDASTVITAAIEDGGKVFVSAGKYTLTSKIILDVAKTLVGAGIFATEFTYTGGDYAVELTKEGTYARNVDIGNFEINFGADAVGGIHINSAKRCTFHDIYVYGQGSNVDVGIEVGATADAGNWFNVMSNIMVTFISNAAGTGKGIYIRPSGDKLTNSCTIVGGMIHHCDNNIYITCGNGHNFHGIDIESGITRDVFCSGRADFYGCRIENDGKDSIECSENGSIGIYGGRISGAGLTGYTWNIFKAEGKSIQRANSLGISRNINHVYFASNYDSLQDCVNAAPDGSEIQLGEGTYTGISLATRTHLHFVGVGKRSSRILGGDADGINISGDSKHITFENLKIDSTAANSLKIRSNAQYIIFKNCLISSGSTAVYFQASGTRPGMEMINCEISGASGYGIHGYATTSEGGAELLIDSCNIHDTSIAGIRAARAHNWTIKNTVVGEPTTQDQNAIELGANSSEIRISGCDLTPSGNGVAIEDSGANNTIGYVRHTDLFMDVLATSATHVRSNEDLSAAAPITFTIDAQPDVPRTLSAHFDSHAQITAYTLEITGIDAKGNTITETKTESDGWDWETSNAFAVLTSVIMTSRTGTGVDDTMDLGITDVLGLSNVIWETGDVFKIKKNSANGIVAGAQVNVTYHTYDMSVIGLSATDDFTVWYRSNRNAIP